MEGGSLSYCFICGGSFQVKESPLMRRCDSFKALKELVLRLCGLLGVGVTPGEWEEVDGDYLMKQTIACEKCFEILRNVERVHELLLKTQQELKVYLDEVESLIIRSDTPNLQCSFWRSSCFKLRRSVLEKILPPPVNVGASDNSLRILIKEECFGDQSAYQTAHEPQNVDSHFYDNHWDASSPPPPPTNGVPADDLLPPNESGDPEESLRTSSVTIDNQSAHLQYDNLLTRKRKRRKITVIAEEDEVPEVRDNFNNFLNPGSSGTRQTRGAKKVAEAALQLYASSGEASDNDEEFNCNTNSPLVQSEDNASSDSEMEGEVMEASYPKTRRNKKLPGLSQKPQWWPFLIAEENLYLYRWDTFVQNTFTHLKCLAYDCGFQTEWEYYPSFQRMRDHLEENHRDRGNRQKTPHPCAQCKIIYKNREELVQHLKDSHPHLFGVKSSKAICEACTKICKPTYIQVHAFAHKNIEEQAAVIEAGEAPLGAIRQMERRIQSKMTKKEPPKVYEENSQPEKQRQRGIPEIMPTDLLKPEVIELVKKPIPKYEMGKSKRKTKNIRKNNRIKKDGQQLRLFIYVTENLYLYRWDTFVVQTLTHLECQAYKCGFKTELDYYLSFQRMRAHLEENHRDRKHRQLTPHPCVPCSTIYKNREEFTKHFNKVHSNSLKKSRAVCEACLMICTSSYVMKHMYSHKNEEEKAEAIANNLAPPKPLQSKDDAKKYNCDYENCTYATNDSNNFKRHKRSHLPKDLRSDFTICSECGVRILKERLNVHIQKLHKPETIDRYLMCKYCDKRYLYREKCKFEAHLRTHTGEKPFLCPECGKTYYDLPRFNYHVKNAHVPKTQEWPCEWCDMVYLNKATLKIHWGRKHPDKWQPQTQYRKLSKFYYDEKEEIKGEVYGPKQMFPCPHCGVLCTYKFTLKKHLMVKHGIGEVKKRSDQPPTFYRREKKKEIEPSEEDDESRSLSADEMPSSSRKTGARKPAKGWEGFPGSSSTFF